MFAASKSGSLAEATDAQFNYVTMLLHGNGTNGAQNNTFLDSSTNNFTITRNGNTTQGTFTPYGSNWSNYFDGSGDYLTCSSSATNFGTGDFTIEFWVNFSNLPSSGSNYNIISATVTTGVEILYRGTGSYIEIGSYSVGPSLQYSWTPLKGAWNHVAFVRSGTTVTIYLNGTSVNSGTVVTNYVTGTTNIGSAGGSTSYFNGYLSNVRVVKSAVYTANFTPSTTPLTAITNTSLLTCADNRFIDDSINNFAITKFGDTSVQRFSPFSPTSSYSTSVIGGSGYFDGTGDYLGVTGATTALAFGSGDFTIEFWGYILQTTPEQMFIDWRPAGTQTTQPLIYVTSAGVLAYYVNAANRITGATLVTNQWYHIAVSRSGTSTKMFLNGVQTGSTWTDTTVYTNTSTRPLIGLDGNTTNSGYLKGNVTDVRTLTGTALYTTTFTPPTAPLTAITNTSLLLSTTNAGILDNAMMNDLETVGNAQISTSVKKYGSGSIAITGSGDYCRGSQPSVVHDINGGNFTIEFWVYFTSLAADRALVSKYGNTAENAGGLGYVAQWSSAGNLVFVLGVGGGSDAVYTFSWSPSISTWYHVAITRSSTSGRAFVNGTQIGSTTTFSVTDVASPNAIQIGKTHTVAQYLLGYMDDVRITKGVARYTANFTAPTTAFADKG